jgi:hypothetical protein
MLVHEVKVGILLGSASSGLLGGQGLAVPRPERDMPTAR